MAITIKIKNKKPESGFTLLIAAIFMSVMLSFGVALSSIGYKQQVLASLAIESQYAFYAANAALECVLYADRQQNRFAYQSPEPPAPFTDCDGSPAIQSNTVLYDADQWVVLERFSLDSGKHCADVVIYKPSPDSGENTKVSSQGYNVSCAKVADPGGARFVSRGLSTRY